MADLKISPNEIRDALKDFVKSYEPAKASRTEVGHVIDAGDGIAHVEGLPSAMANELLKFADGTLGLALNLDEREIGTVVLGNFEGIVEGMEVHRTGEVGRGQRQLIIGDRQTGKTAIAIDTIINQKANWESGDAKKQVRCIYVAVGQKGSTIASVKASLEAAGAMEYTTIVASPASDPAGFKYLAPYTGSAIGQHWMYGGKHVLIIFDDLSKQAEAYRAVSLLLRRPPGREAYPGDVFYLHSRLLERCAKLNDELGAGSMTGLPIIETKANDVSAYIPTNVISITDGQIFLQSDLFNSNQRPAIDVGISVSRVGGAAQVKGIKKVSGTLKLELAQYRSLEAFAMFASDLDAASRQQLARGARLTELLKQPQYSPYPVEEQTVSIWAGTTGLLDEVPVEDVLRFEGELLEHLRRNSKALTTIRETNNLDDDTIAELTKQVAKFKKSFATRSGASLASSASAEALDEEEVQQEKIVKQKRKK